MARHKILQTANSPTRQNRKLHEGCIPINCTCCKKKKKKKWGIASEYGYVACYHIPGQVVRIQTLLIVSYLNNLKVQSKFSVIRLACSNEDFDIGNV